MFNVDKFERLKYGTDTELQNTTHYVWYDGRQITEHVIIRDISRCDHELHRNFQRSQKSTGHRYKSGYYTYSIQEKSCQYRHFLKYHL